MEEKIQPVIPACSCEMIGQKTASQDHACLEDTADRPGDDILRALGDSKTPLYMLVLSTVVTRTSMARLLFSLVMEVAIIWP